VGLDLGLGTFSGQRPADGTQTVQDGYADIRALAVHAEHSGFDSVWLASHHGHPAEHISAPLVVLASVAAVTTRIRLGTAMVVAPLQAPVRFAEDCATLDQLSGGRLTVGLAAGWRAAEFAMFGVDLAERATCTTQLARFCRAAWDSGTAEVDGRTVLVRPRPAGRIPLAMGGSAPGALRRAGQLADLFIATGTPAIGIDALRRQVQAVDVAAGQAGRGAADVDLGFQANCWVSADGRLPEVVSAAMWNQIGASLAAHAGTADRPARDDHEVLRRAVTGTPDAVVEQLAPWVEALRARNPHLVVRLHYPGLDRGAAEEAIALFADGVAPALRELAG
jgi:alkanesulfonate monooxygenase SsuD/methylene tetrahydromethanopterin reductase-like flavin-dependent oxidoreductase (luciferase family)